MAHVKYRVMRDRHELDHARIPCMLNFYGESGDMAFSIHEDSLDGQCEGLTKEINAHIKGQGYAEVTIFIDEDLERCPKCDEDLS